MHNWYQNCIFINRLKPNVMDNVKVNFKGSPVTLVGTHLQTGDKAPRFTVLDGDLQPVSLSQYKDKNLIISSFPVGRHVGLRPAEHPFQQRGQQTERRCRNPFDFGGPALCTKRFCAAEGIDNVHVYSDYRDLDFGMKYGFVIKELRLLARGVIVIDKKGIIRYIEYVPEIAQEPNYEAALKAVKELE